MTENTDTEDAKSKGILWFFGTLTGVTLVVLFILGIWWGQEPDTFDVREQAVVYMKKSGTDSMPLGFVYTNTLAHMAEVLMEKPGGYISNDVAPPGVFLDNIRSWEYGALVMLSAGRGICSIVGRVILGRSRMLSTDTAGTLVSLQC